MVHSNDATRFYSLIYMYVCQLSIVHREGLTFDISTVKGLVINIKLKTVCYFLITVTVYSVQRQR